MPINVLFNFLICLDMAKVNYKLSTKVDKHTGKSEVLIRFIANQYLMLRAKSSVFVDPQYWSDKKQKVNIPKMVPESIAEDCRRTQQALFVVADTIYREFSKTPVEEVNKEWLMSVIDLALHPETHGKRRIQTLGFDDTFMEFLDRHAASDERKKQYVSMYNILKRYEVFKQIFDSRFRLDVRAFDLAMVREFEDYLKKECELAKQYPILGSADNWRHRPRPRGLNRNIGILTDLRTFFNWCVREEVIPEDSHPFAKYEMPLEHYGTPYYISVEERRQLYAAPMPKKLERSRDLFVFQCLVGCRRGDLFRFTKANIVDGELVYIPRKTRDGRPVTVAVPLNKTAQEILDKYHDDDRELLFPIPSKPTYDREIKKIFTIAGITRNVVIRNSLTGEEEIRPINEVASSHMARRTFVGNLYKQIKDPALIAKLSGHTEHSAAFARYRTIDREMREEVVRLLD